MGCVYCATNKISGKKYIGKTIKSLCYRRKRHEYDSKRGSNTVFHRALRKYGFNNFEWEILFESKREKALNFVEIDEIKYWNTRSPSGYNRTDGGEGTSGRVVSKESKDKCRKSVKKIWDDTEYKDRVSKSMSESHKGKKRSQETKDKISNTLMGHFVSEDTKGKQRKAWARIKEEKAKGIQQAVNEAMSNDR